MVEAVEQDQPIGAGAVELAREVGEDGEEWRELDGHRNVHVRFTSRTVSTACALDLGAGRLRVGRELVEVQLQRVRAGLLHQPRIVEPAAGVAPLSDAITGMRDRFLHPPQVIQVLVGPERERVGGRKVARGFGERVVMGVAGCRSPPSARG